MKPTAREAAAELLSMKCRCGDAKPVNKPFCRCCFQELSPKLRAKLSLREVGDGYEAAFHEALTALGARVKA